MGLAHSPRIVTDGLIFCLDAGNIKSYSGSGTDIYDLVNDETNTLSGDYGIDTSSYSIPTLKLNTTTDVSGNATQSNGRITLITEDLDTLAQNQSFSVMFAAKKNFYGIGGNNNGNSQLFQGVTNGYTSGWRINENHQGTEGEPFSSNHTWSLGYNDQNTALGVSDSASSTNRMCIVAFTVSPTTIFGFCNGNTNSRSNPGTYVSGTSSPKISFTGAGVGSWNGLVGSFMIYNRTITELEIQQNFNALRGRFGI